MRLSGAITGWTSAGGCCAPLRRLGAVSAALLLLLAVPAWAQETSAPASGGNTSSGTTSSDGVGSDNDEPIEISADNGIE